MDNQYQSNLDGQQSNTGQGNDMPQIDDIGTPPAPDNVNQNQGEPMDSSVPASDNSYAPSNSSGNSNSNNNLQDIKSQALSQLTPLLSHLDQSPEEHFRTTMMLIQASDNQSLIQDAYDAAQQIPDEKAKAQALLDIVNEINYFSQNSS